MDEQIDRILKGTLADYRLSRGEKGVVQDVLRKLGGDTHQAALLRNRAFQLAAAELSDPNGRAIVDWLEDIVKALVTKQPDQLPSAESAFSPDDNCPGKIAGLFSRAHTKVDVCVFTITDDRITDAIMKTHDSGVPIRIITDDDKATDIGSDVRTLERHGVPVRVDHSQYHMHHKFALFDEQTLLTGSYNWTRSAAQHNEENFIITYDHRLIRDFSREFEKLWDKLG